MFRIVAIIFDPATYQMGEFWVHYRFSLESQCLLSMKYNETSPCIRASEGFLVVKHHDLRESMIAQDALQVGVPWQESAEHILH